MKIENQEQFDMVHRFLRRVWNSQVGYYGEEIENYLDELEDALLAYKGVKIIY